jgi:ribosomal protein S18 acetylase RimI-like enzyme
MGKPVIEELDLAGAERELPALAAILAACVAGGASVNFVLPFSEDDAALWWRRKALPALAAGERRLLVARREGRVVGTAQLDTGTPPNQRHRADVTKVLVAPEARRRGVARALMLGIERAAREEGRRLLVLDTVEGSAAEALYLSLGYLRAGSIPRFARSPDGARLEATVFLWKELA